MMMLANKSIENDTCWYNIWLKKIRFQIQHNFHVFCLWLWWLAKRLQFFARHRKHLYRPWKYIELLLCQPKLIKLACPEMFMRCLQYHVRGTGKDLHTCRWWCESCVSRSSRWWQPRNILRCSLGWWHRWLQAPLWRNCKLRRDRIPYLRSLRSLDSPWWSWSQ